MKVLCLTVVCDQLYYKIDNYFKLPCAAEMVEYKAGSHTSGSNRARVSVRSQKIKDLKTTGLKKTQGDEEENLIRSMQTDSHRP